MWMRFIATITTYWTLTTFFHHLVESGLTTRLDRPTRDVYPELEIKSNSTKSQVCIVGDVLYNVNDKVPSEHPCLQCRCQPPGVQCETITCKEKKIGCKTIHKPNECCPHFQCECEYNGATYSNGERIKNMPGKECQACYCKGGEIQCTNLKCYVRDDCEGKKIAGQCCPTYDHCPINGVVDKSKSSNKSIPNLSLKNITLLIVEGQNIQGSNVQETLNEIVQKTSPENLPIKIIDISSLSEDKNKLCIEKTNLLKSKEELQKEYTELNNIEYETDSVNDLSTASSTHILSLVKFKNKPNPITTLSPLTMEVTSEKSTDDEFFHEDTKNSAGSYPGDENPAYPAIPDIMTLATEEPMEEENVSFNSISSTAETLNKDTKILPEILQIRNNNTIPENATHSEWLKMNNNTLVNLQALLPSDIISEFVESDLELNLDDAEITTNANDGEQWIPIEVQRFEMEKDIDLVPNNYTENTSLPINETKTLETLDNSTEINSEKSLTDSELMQNLTSTNSSVFKTVAKRSVNDDDDIFRQLDKELELPGTQTQKTKEEEEIESQQIFRELLEETSTPRSKPTGKDAEMIEKLTAALSKMVFQKSTVDANIFGVLKDLFGSQYKAYNNGKSV